MIISVFQRRISMRALHKQIFILVACLGLLVGTQTASTLAAQTKTKKKSSNSSRLETIPSGTEVVVRTNEPIDSKTTSSNQTYSAQVDEDVVAGSGEVVVPKGSDAKLVMRKGSTGGVTGSPDILLDIHSITVRGRRYLVSTADLDEKSNTGIGKNKRTAEMIGGGAVLGAVIGAIAGGGKGAAIGGAAGGAAGAGTEVLVKGKEVRVPAETVLRFKLDKPVSLHAAR
jgi:hypothetical protein